MEEPVRKINTEIYTNNTNIMVDGKFVQTKKEKPLTDFLARPLLADTKIRSKPPAFF